jgi:hypothetical protein
MKHPTPEQFAQLFSENPQAAETFGRHLAEVCPDCGDAVRRMEALLQRFHHWDPEVAVREGLEADELLATLVAAGPDFEIWSREVERREELQTWGVAWVALEHAKERMAAGVPGTQARDFALVAAAIAGTLGTSYHPEWIQDLNALALATSLAAEDRSDEREPLRAETIESRLNRAAAVMAALARGTGSENVKEEVLSLLSRVLA